MLAFVPGLTSYEPWEFALVGAAAFSTGVVRAISTIVIVYEVSGQPHLLLPLSGVLIHPVIVSIHRLINAFCR